eukprot:scaffold581_cov263-Pinguiococcus_pyrenoidosus.AAC.6
MYCTGGVRCEKASAYVNMAVGAGSTAGKVMQLQGGIHRYLEEYGEAGLFCGSNFVFDNRVEVPPQGKAQTTTTATATTTTTTASAANGSESRRGLPEALSESSKPADVSERTAGSISSAIRRKVEETKLAVGSCEECGGKNVAESAGTRLVLPVRLQDGVRCRSCRMLVMACDACTQRHGIDLFCSKCRAEGLGGRGRMEIQSGIDSLKRRFENPRFRGRRNKSRRLALRRKLALLEESRFPHSLRLLCGAFHACARRVLLLAEERFASADESPNKARSCTFTSFTFSRFVVTVVKTRSEGSCGSLAAIRGVARPVFASVTSCCACLPIPAFCPAATSRRRWRTKPTAWGLRVYPSNPGREAKMGKGDSSSWDASLGVADPRVLPSTSGSLVGTVTSGCSAWLSFF